MKLNNAGGTPGGAGSFFLGLGMILAGGYLFLKSVRVYYLFGFGYPLMHLAGVRVTSGMMLLPLILGLGMVFYNGRSALGWLLFLGNLLAICVGVIASIDFSLAGMSLLDLLIILGLLAGGAGLFLRSLRSH